MYVSSFYLYSENRYLLFMTENFAALTVLQQHLLCDQYKSLFVLFGSSFPKDMEYTQVTKVNMFKTHILSDIARLVPLSGHFHKN